MAGRIFCCFFILPLLVGSNSSLKTINHFYRLPGQNLTITCYNFSLGSWRIFCKENCQGENILLNTTSNKAARGRNSIEYFESVFDKSYNLTVEVSSLTPSDSGLYRCGLTDSLSTFAKFKVVVAEALLDGRKDHDLRKDAGSSLTVACSFSFSGKTKYFCRGQCEEEENILVYTDGDTAQSGRYSIGFDRYQSSDVFFVTIKNLTSSDSGRYRCLSYLNSGKNSHLDFNVSVSGVSSETTDPSPLDQNYRATCRELPLIVIVVTLAVTVVLLSAAVIVSYRKRSERGLEMRGSVSQPMETFACERIPSEDLIYENLEPASRNQE
ncbi:polymeric immunoglobulin receptor-like isoform X1 [Gambusia affinis]|uniref:polymeric immunoglobulin receptor-like isoform X1 n=1 Tax=Gambusia affinis TaxID=33528 RepID=UPI001CDCC622|nr:polymeric immunoglobulin receptor-like isoform X1 [Gambusia affinis]